MDDRQLLEAAAKAAGYTDAEWQDMEGWGEVRYGFSSAIWTGEKYWNPLAKDGDALRLAVALGLVVDCSRPSAGPPFYSHTHAEIEMQDCHAATRRAIVSAAAALAT
jgi:hypothetical protein